MHAEVISKLKGQLGDTLHAVYWQPEPGSTQTGVLSPRVVWGAAAAARPMLLLVVTSPPAWEWLATQLVPLALGDAYQIGVADKAVWSAFLAVHGVAHRCWPDALQPLWLADEGVWGPKPLAAATFCAYVGQQLKELSLLLAPALLPPAVAAALTGRLRRLAAWLLADEVVGEKTAVSLLAALHTKLNHWLDELPDDVWPAYSRLAPTEAPLPHLHAIYRTEQEQVLLLFDELVPELWQTAVWEGLAADLGEGCTGLQVATVHQAQLVLAQQTPLDRVFERYQLDWGGEALTAVSPQPHAIWQQAARLPLHLLIERLPQACLAAAADSDKQHRIIHDFQNKLLNVQLEHEILVRLGRVERFRPPTPLPERDAPVSVRIDAIFSQLHDWISFYQQKMEASALS